VVLEQAENRLHLQKGLMVKLLEASGAAAAPRRHPADRLRELLRV
jgi:hypothetical protein